ncbi:hypothetical protein SANTM175S_08640 [Streptomyces antimycoticus]
MASQPGPDVAPTADRRLVQSGGGPAAATTAAFGGCRRPAATAVNSKCALDSRVSDHGGAPTPSLLPDAGASWMWVPGPPGS